MPFGFVLPTNTHLQARKKPRPPRAHLPGEPPGQACAGRPAPSCWGGGSRATARKELGAAAGCGGRRPVGPGERVAGRGGSRAPGGREGKPRGSGPAQGATLDPDPGPRPQPRSETRTHDPASEPKRATPPSRPHRSRLDRACPAPRRGLAIRAAAARRLWGSGSVGGRPGSGIRPLRPPQTRAHAGQTPQCWAGVAGQPLPASTHDGQGRPRPRDPGPRPRQSGRAHSPFAAADACRAGASSSRARWPHRPAAARRR